MSQPELMLATIFPEDWPEVCAIYAEGIATGHATFETETSDWPKWNADHLECCRLIARAENEIVGWAALSRVSSRAVYTGVAEVSVYIAARARGQRVGWPLLQALVEQSERAGIWTLQASIFTENAVSIHLHERCGFRIVGRREKIGCLHGVWRDTLLLERRSTIAGK
jgi:L-amino acid N-acyltransferase YncA